MYQLSGFSFTMSIHCTVKCLNTQNGEKNFILTHLSYAQMVINTANIGVY